MQLYQEDPLYTPSHRQVEGLLGSYKYFATSTNFLVALFDAY